MNLIFRLNEKTGQKIVWVFNEGKEGCPSEMTFVAKYNDWIRYKKLFIERFIEVWRPHINTCNYKFIIKSMWDYIEKRSTTKERWQRRKLMRSVNNMGIKKMRKI